MKKIGKFFRVYWWPLVIAVVALEIGSGVFTYYFSPPGILEQGDLLKVEAIITVLATFTGIFIPLQITRNQKKESDRRTLAFVLGLIWTELRKNGFILEQIKVNYKFNGLFVISDFKGLIKMILGKYKFVHVATNKLQDKSFVSSQNSGAINTFDNDDVFNNVTQAYENLTNFELASLLTLETLKMKDHLIKFSPEILTPNDESMFIGEVRECLKNGYKELLFCQKTIERAIEAVDKKLNEMGVVSEKEPRRLEDVLEVP